MKQPRQTISQQEFRKLTNEVAIEIIIQPAFMAFKTLDAIRTKRAVSKLNENGYDAKVSLFDKKLLIVQL